MKKSKYGISKLSEGGNDLSGIPYIISWLDILNYWEEAYDEIGKISPIIISPDNIHVQDLIIIPPRANSTDNTAIKEAILKYGSIAVGFYGTTNATYYIELP